MDCTIQITLTAFCTTPIAPTHSGNILWYMDCTIHQALWSVSYSLYGTGSFGNTILLYSQIFQDFFNMITFSGAARYKKDSGPYPWEQEGQLKILNDVMKTLGFTGSTGDPETIIKNIRSSSERIGR